MNAPRQPEVCVGDPLPTLELPSVDRSMLALFAGASGDHNAVHIDIDAARRAGMPDVFAHGMLGMAWIARMVTEWRPQSALRSLDVRFQGITHLGNALRCSGRVVEIIERSGERCARVGVDASNQYGQSKLIGEALVAIGGTQNDERARP